MAPTAEFSSDYKNIFDFDLDTLNTSIWGGPHMILEIWPFFDPVLPTPIKKKKEEPITAIKSKDGVLEDPIDRDKS